MYIVLAGIDQRPQHVCYNSSLIIGICVLKILPVVTASPNTAEHFLQETPTFLRPGGWWETQTQTKIDRWSEGTARFKPHKTEINKQSRTIYWSEGWIRRLDSDGLFHLAAVATKRAPASPQSKKNQLSWQTSYTSQDGGGFYKGRLLCHFLESPS